MGRNSKPKCYKCYDRAVWCGYCIDRDDLGDEGIPYGYFWMEMYAESYPAYWEALDIAAHPPATWLLLCVDPPGEVAAPLEIPWLW